MLLQVSEVNDVSINSYILVMHFDDLFIGSVEDKDVRF